MWLRITVAGTVALAEAIPGVGAVLPGEVTISALSGAIVGPDRPWLLLAVFAGASTGDQVDYWLGRRLGPRLAASRLVQRIGARHWARGVDLVRIKGPYAVTLSRVLPMVRTVVPVAAGAARMNHLRFSLASLAGCALWSLAWVFAGATAARLARTSALPVLLLGLAGAALWLSYRALSGRMRHGTRHHDHDLSLPGGRGEHVG